MNWTDEKVKEFCRVYTSGKYWEAYKYCKTMDQKLKRFKELDAHITTTLDDCPF